MPKIFRQKHNVIKRLESRCPSQHQTGIWYNVTQNRITMEVEFLEPIRLAPFVPGRITWSSIVKDSKVNRVFRAVYGDMNIGTVHCRVPVELDDDDKTRFDARASITDVMPPSSDEPPRRFLRFDLKWDAREYRARPHIPSHITVKVNKGRKIVFELPLPPLGKEEILDAFEGVEGLMIAIKQV